MARPGEEEVWDVKQCPFLRELEELGVRKSWSRKGLVLSPSNCQLFGGAPRCVAPPPFRKLKQSIGAKL